MSNDEMPGTWDKSDVEGGETDVAAPRHLPARFADVAMYQAEEHVSDPSHGVLPKVTLLNATPDPLGAIAAKAMMYEGRVVRDLGAVTDYERRHYFQQILKTHLQTPLEDVQFQFLFEGVDRSITHQIVRKRVGLSVAQESLRFAVPGDLGDATSLPPSLQGTQGIGPHDMTQWDRLSPEEQAQERRREDWDWAVASVDAAYHRLVDAGMPAEEARGLLPQATATRMNATYSLRALADEAGNRLCTQAQFHWKLLFAGILNAIRSYGDDPQHHMPFGARWQYQFIADSMLFRPVCYSVGHCPFNASFDRGCKIRDRVSEFATGGVESSLWESVEIRRERAGAVRTFRRIDRAEWAMDPSAAVVRPGAAGRVP